MGENQHDANAATWESASETGACELMSETLNVLVLERCDPSQDVSRFYILRIERSHFGDPTLVRKWGRIYQRGR